MTSRCEPRRIVLCVDDCGLHEDIDAAALTLADAGRISACSALVDGPSWSRLAPALRERDSDSMEVGLHLNLTEASAGCGNVVSLPWLLPAAFARLLDRARLRDSLQRQFDGFERALRRPPDFVDGHQHVHQLPVVRDELLQLLAERGGAVRPWLRVCVAPRWARAHRPNFASRLKASTIERLGARSFAVAAQRAGLEVGHALLGARGLRADAASLTHDVHAWLAAASDGDVWMAHPARPGAASDRLRAARECEFELLASQRFGDWLAQAQVQIATMRAILQRRDG